MNDTLQGLLLLCGLLCLLPVGLTLLVGLYAVRYAQRQLENLTNADAEKLHARYVTLQGSSSSLSSAPHEAHVRRIIHEQSLRCGVVGLVTGLGGFVTLPIAMPIDYLLTTRTQVAMVRFIAAAYGRSESLSEKLTTYAVLSGSETVTKTSVRLIVQLLTRFLGKWLSKFIPIVGALISFAVNYAFAQSLGRAAMLLYSKKQPSSA
ncbi:MAG: hypothetical protein RML73_08365 [Anaerolineae bacterium]|nr:hypothetical protein [Anaerolineae bacterium]